MFRSYPASSLARKSGGSWHIFGLFRRPNSASLRDEFEWMNAERRARVARICKNLNDAGIPIDPMMCWHSAGEGTVGRPACRQGLIANGYAIDVSDAFKRYLTLRTSGYAV